jgi:hypothetical protein
VPTGENEKPYDLYFTSFGTFSHHNDDETAITLLAEMAKNVENYSLIVCDWLGRWSYEWQDLWNNDIESLKNMDYVVSYIYEEEEREAKRDQLDHLTLRLMSRPEAEHIIDEASKRAGVKIKPLQFFDRSVFIGRHMDTGEYNRQAQPIRKAVNSLHETNTRTELEALLVDYVPKEGFEFLNDYYERLQMSWNTLVQYVIQLLDLYDTKTRTFIEQPTPIPASYPEYLQQKMQELRKLVEGVGWLDYGLPRENIIEPQLGYALRFLVMQMQQGQGCGHGLVGILEVDRG